MFSAPHESDVSGAVNAPAEVTLYDPSGKSVRVPEADAAYWLAQGFAREAVDLAGAAAQFAILLKAAGEAAVAFAAGVQADGVIDPADDAQYHTVIQALREAEQAWGRLERAAHAQYPIAQGQGVAMVTPEGAAVAVDPGQVALYAEKGWAPA